MKKKLTCQLLMGVSAIATSTLMVACNSGTSSNNNNGSQQQVVVSSQSQIRTPVSAKTIFSKSVSNYAGNKNLKSSSSTDSCIQLATQSNGQNYITQTSGSQYWGTASITIGLTNTCSTPQPLNTQVVFNNALINGTQVPSQGFSFSETGSPWSTVTGTAGVNPSVTVTSPTCSGSCNWAQLAPGATLGITAQISGGYAMNSFTVDNVEIVGQTPPAPPTTGTLALDLSATGLSNVCSGSTNCNFQVNVISPANVVVASQTLNANSSSSANYNITNLAPGNYSINVVESSVPSVSTGTITYTVTPGVTASVSAGATVTTNVNFGFTANPVNQVTIDLNTANIPAQFKNNTVYARILDANGNTVVSGIQFTNGNLSSTKSSSAFITGQTYTLQVQGLADPQSGVYYSPIIEDFTVTGSTTTVNSNAYQQVPANQLYSVNLAVQSPISGQTISYGSDTNYYSYATDTFTAGTYTFLESDTITLTPGAVSGYTSTFSPTNTLTVANKGQTVTLVNTQAVSTLQYCVDSLCQAQLSTLNLASNANEINTQTIFVQNLGSTSATLPMTPSFSANVNGLTVTPGSCGSTLAPNAICSLNVSYLPTSAVSPNSAIMTYDSAPLKINYQTTSNTSPVMAEYWCGFSGSFCGQSTGNDVNAAATHVVMAFANTNANGSISVDSANWPTSLISGWQNARQKVLISVGGENVNWTSVFANTNIFAQSVQSVVQQYGLNGVDLDIENGTATPQQVADAINLLRQYLGESAIITIAPQNVGVAQNVGYIPAANAANGVGAWNFFVPVLNNSLNSLTLVMQQDYNNPCGSMNSVSAQYFECSYLSWVNAPNASAVTGGSQLNGFNGVPVSKLIIGTIASASAGGASYYGGMTPIQQAYTGLQANYGYTPRGFMFWDSYWDSLNSYTISNGIASMMNM